MTAEYAAASAFGGRVAIPPYGRRPYRVSMNPPAPSTISPTLTIFTA